MNQEDKNRLPSGWVECAIEDITLPVTKIDPRDEPERVIRYIDISGIDNVRNIVAETKSYPLANAPSRARQIVKTGDVLFATVRPYLRNIASVPECCDDEIASTGFSVLRGAFGIDPSFLFYKCISTEFVNSLSVKQYGVSYPAVKDEQVRERPVLLPPGKEQQRIVAKIEELFSELDDGIQSLKTAQEQLRVYRQALLKHAFEGRLTEKWRTENKDHLESAQQLLARIEKDREARHQQQITDWNDAVRNWEAKGRKGKKPTKPRKLMEADKPNPDHQQKMWALPETWQWVQIGDFAFVTKLAGFEYTKFVRYVEDGDFPVIKAENAGPRGYRVTNYSRVHASSVAELTRSHLDGGELLMVFVGAGTGNVATVPRDQKFFLGPNIGMIRPESEAINTRYVELFLRSPKGKDIALASVKAVAQPSLSMATIRQTPVALPTTSEQVEIVSILEKTLSIIDRAEAEINDQLLKSDALRQSILKNAFAGKLAAQDSNDEPASVLLERIKSEKAERENGKKKNGRRKAA